MQVFQQSITDPNFVQNPYAAYDKARKMGDVVYWQDYNMPAALSHRSVRYILTHKSMGRTPPQGHQSACPAHISDWQENENHSMLELEPPNHTRQRSLVLRAFTSRRIAAQKNMIADLSCNLIDDFPANNPFDFLTHFAQPLPVIVITRLLGVPEGERQILLRWSNAMVAMYQSGRTKETELTANTATIEFSAFLSDYITHRRKAPKDDLMSELIATQTQEGRLSEAELISTCILLLNAGHEATVHTLGNGLNLLLQNKCTQITQNTVEEILRYDPPLHIFTRWAYDDIDCFGFHIAKNTQIACVLGAANRDEAVFNNPHHFDADRPIKPHMGFGAGIHFCVGAPLARLEIEIGLQTMLARCPNLRLAQRAEYGDTYHFHGLAQLMVQRQ